MLFAVCSFFKSLCDFAVVLSIFTFFGFATKITHPAGTIFSFDFYLTHRKANLKYTQADYGMIQPKWIGRKTDFIFRAVRTEGAVIIRENKYVVKQ